MEPECRLTINIWPAEIDPVISAYLKIPFLDRSNCKLFLHGNLSLKIYRRYMKTNRELLVVRAMRYFLTMPAFKLVSILYKSARCFKILTFALFASFVYSYSAVPDDHVVTSSFSAKASHSTTQPIQTKTVEAANGNPVIEVTSRPRRARYICTPSGFGQKSKCYRR